jgi:hypothetical protein
MMDRPGVVGVLHDQDHVAGEPRMVDAGEGNNPASGTLSAPWITMSYVG